MGLKYETGGGGVVWGSYLAYMECAGKLLRSQDTTFVIDKRVYSISLNKAS